MSHCYIKAELGWEAGPLELLTHFLLIELCQRIENELLRDFGVHHC